MVCRGLVAGGAQAARSGVSSAAASNSGSASFLAYTPTSTLAITGASTTPHSASGSVAGPLALTPVRRMDLPHQGMPLNVIPCCSWFFIFCTCSVLLYHLYLFCSIVLYLKSVVGSCCIVPYSVFVLPLLYLFCLVCSVLLYPTLSVPVQPYCCLVQCVSACVSCL